MKNGIPMDAVVGVAAVPGHDSHSKSIMCTCGASAVTVFVAGHGVFDHVVLLHMEQLA
jgi:hypothetical protein